MAKVSSVLAFYCLILILPQIFVKAERVICKFNSMKCISYDKDMVEFPKCFIKAVSRSDNYMRIHVKIKQIVYKVSVRISLYKRANGWKPFLYDIKFDGCKFLKNHKANPLAHFFYNVITEYVNLNHTCPYDHDVHMDKFRLTNANMPLKFPEGEYAVDTQWTVNDKKLARINGSCISI